MSLREGGSLGAHLPGKVFPSEHVSPGMSFPCNRDTNLGYSDLAICDYGIYDHFNILHYYVTYCTQHHVV